jgi:hypothetical protein
MIAEKSGCAKTSDPETFSRTFEFRRVLNIRLIYLPPSDGKASSWTLMLVAAVESLRTLAENY